MADLNECTSRTLGNIAEIPLKLAENIVSVRKLNGGFQNYDDLIRIDGMSRTYLKTIKDNTVLTEMPTKCNSEIVEEKNRNNSGKRKSKKQIQKTLQNTKTVVQKGKSAPGTSGVMVPLLRMDQTGSSPASALPSPVKLLTPVKVTPSKSGHKIIAEYRVLTEDKTVTHAKRDRPRTKSSRVSVQVNPPSACNNKTNRPDTSKYRKLSQSKERSIRSWLKGMNRTSPKRSLGRFPEVKDRSNSSSPKKKEARLSQSAKNKISKRRPVHYSPIRDIDTDYSESRVTPGTSRRRSMSKDTNKKEHLRVKHGRPHIGRNTPRPSSMSRDDNKKEQNKNSNRNKQLQVKHYRPHVETHTPPRRSVKAAVYDNGRLNVNHRTPHEDGKTTSKGDPRAVVEHGRYAESYQKLTGGYGESNDKRAYIRRSSYTQERSVTPATSHRDFYNSQSRSEIKSSPSSSSDASLISTRGHNRSRERRRRRKRHGTTSRGKDVKRHRESRRDNKDDDQAPPCALL